MAVHLLVGEEAGSAFAATVTTKLVGCIRRTGGIEKRFGHVEERFRILHRPRTDEGLAQDLQVLVIYLSFGSEEEAAHCSFLPASRASSSQMVLSVSPPGAM